MELLAKPKFRGERVNNPFNINESKNPWIGKSDVEIDSRFEEFIEPIYGIRAGFKILRTYVEKYHLNTINKIFDRYAPPNENDTEAYKKLVCDETGLGLDDPIDDLKSIGLQLGKSIIHMEQGRVIYPDEMIQEGLELAFQA